MPPQEIAEISLRHLPDISDISFQIPSADDYGERLLANDDDDFLRGADDSIDAPTPEKTEYKPLTLSQLTPKPKPKPNSIAVGPSVSTVCDRPGAWSTEIIRGPPKEQSATTAIKIAKFQTDTSRPKKIRPKLTGITGSTTSTSQQASRQLQDFRPKREPFASASSSRQSATAVGSMTEHHVKSFLGATSAVTTQVRRRTTPVSLSAFLVDMTPDCLA
jgi:hypothetical protein